MQREKKKKLIIIFAVIAAIAVIVAGVLIFKFVRQRDDGQMYTYIDYNEGTTKEINYYIDDEDNAYNYVGKEKAYVLVSPDIVERNKAGELTVDSRNISADAGSTVPSTETGGAASNS